jgi:hypothetical protein
MGYAHLDYCIQLRRTSFRLIKGINADSKKILAKVPEK